ncbi:MAG TPA: hypothetical protein VFA12_20665 [Stellaceae bacterium]|nr:hypothetical protein [Stellaceae bacterium]
MTDTPSSIPPMAPSAEERAEQIVQAFNVLGDKRTVMIGLSAAYRDGWNAALSRLRKPTLEIVQAVDAARREIIKAVSRGELDVILGAVADYLGESGNG